MMMMISHYQHCSSKQNNDFDCNLLETVSDFVCSIKSKITVKMLLQDLNLEEKRYEQARSQKRRVN